MKKFLLIFLSIFITTSIAAFAFEKTIEINRSNGYYWKNSGVSSDAWAPEWRANSRNTSGTLLILSATTGINTANGNIYSATGSGHTYTLTAATNCTIKSYSINGKATDADITITPSGGNGTTVTDGSSLGTALSVTVNASSTTFTLTSSAAAYLENVSLIVTLEVDDATTKIDATKHYRIFTQNTGTSEGDTKYYLKADGSLTSTESDAGWFSFTATTSYNYTPAGWAYKITTGNGSYFSNPAGNSGETRNGKINTRKDNQTIRDNWDAQVFFLKDGKYAIRGTNTPAGNGYSCEAFWTVNPDNTNKTDDDTWPEADYTVSSHSPQYVWQLDPMVTYKLKYNNEVIATTYKVRASGAPVLPTEWNRAGCTYTFDTEEIDASTETVTVTMAWNGPFQLSSAPSEGVFANTTKWYTVGIQSYYEAANHIWKYDGSNYVITEAVSRNAYASINDNHLFCFVGNPYNGISIYNKAVGSSKTLYKSATKGEQVQMESTGSLFVPDASTEDGRTVANGYICFKLKDGSVRLNCYADENYKLKGWDDSGNGSTCWFITPSQYPYNFLNGLVLDAPYGAVGTKDVDESTYINAASSKTYFAENPFYYAEASNRTISNNLLDILANASEITLDNGYWRIVSAKFINPYRSLVFNQSLETPSSHDISSAIANKIVWSVTDETCAGNIFYLRSSGTSFSIKNCNKNEYLSSCDGTTSGTSTNTTFNLLSGSVQYNLVVNAGTLHAQGWNWGGTHGTEVGDLVNYSGGVNSPSAWYIVKATDVAIALNGPVDGYYYATLCLPFDVTIEGATPSTLTVSGTSLVATACEDNKVPAGTPVLLKGTNEKATATINTGESFGSALACDLTGTFVEKSVTAGTDYFLGSDGTNVGFYHWEGSKVPANRAYFEASKLSGGSNGFKLVFADDDDVTAVAPINAESVKGNAQLYDLQGRKVASPRKGQIYIQNGKAVLY